MNPDQSQGDPVAEAMQRRNMGGQSSQQAPAMGGQSMTPMMDMGGQMPMGGSPMGAPKSDKFVPSNSHELLVSTLQESLKNEYKLKEQELKFGQQAPMM